MTPYGTATLSTSHPSTVDAKCGAGEVALSGGYFVSGGTITIIWEAPAYDDGNGGVGYAFGTPNAWGLGIGPTDATFMYVFAVCATVGN